MVNYRRCYLNGGKYFFAVTLRNRKSNLLLKNVDLLRDSMKKGQLKHPYKIDAMVVLPDHIHAIWQLPHDDANYSLRWRQIKNNFTRGLLKIGYRLNKDHRGE